MARRISDLESHPQNFVTAADFARFVPVQRKTVIKWIEAGVLRAYRFPPLIGRWRIKKADAIEFMEQARFAPPQP